MRIFFDGITNIERPFGLDVPYLRTLSECNAVHYIIGFVVYQFQLNMFLIASYHFTCTIVIYIVRTKHRLMIVRSERVKLFQVGIKAWSDLFEVNFSVDVYHGTGLFRQNMFGYELFEAACEFFYILYFHRQSGCVCVSSEVFQ